MPALQRVFQIQPIIIYQKNPAILYHETIVQEVSILKVNLCSLHSYPDPDSQTMAKARALYVYVIPLFVSVLARSRTVAICPTGMKRETLGAMLCRNGLLLRKMTLNITSSVLKVN